MMTPKGKAEELLKKMDVIHYMKLGGKNKDSKGLPVSMRDDQIKQCALIAVNEIIENVNYFFDDEIDYWEQVIDEIKKL